MTREEVKARIEEIGIIPVVRLNFTEDALFAAEAVSSSGIPIVEVTMTVPGAVQVIRDLTRQNPNVLVGAGTVLDVETAGKCLDAGAQFLTSSELDLGVGLHEAHQHDEAAPDRPDGLAVHANCGAACALHHDPHGYSTVTLFARFLGWSTLQPRRTAT